MPRLGQLFHIRKVDARARVEAVPHLPGKAKIIGARISFGTSDINYHHSTVPSTSQSISITATATFVKKDSDFVDYSPPSPPVAISVPHDVWYPFKIDSHSDRRTPFLSLTWIFAASLVVVNQ